MTKQKPPPESEAVSLSDQTGDPSDRIEETAEELVGDANSNADRYIRHSDVIADHLIERIKTKSDD